MKIKKILSLLLAAAMLCSLTVFSSAVSAETASVPSFVTDNNQGLYVHGVRSVEDTEAWQLWQSSENEDGYAANEKQKYFFMPGGADKTQADIYNNYSFPVNVNGTEIPSKSTATVNYENGKNYTVIVNSANYSLCFKNSTAEAAIYVNNPDADGQGTELYSYLITDKSKSAKATGAVVDSSGNVDNTTIKKIKGRGNTTWDKAKKPFNVTYDAGVSIGGMEQGKKYSLLANYQDASLSRNRFLYDLSDAVGVPYAPDSRYVDFYIDGVYYGSYQCCQKIEVGSKDLINDISDTDYLNADGTLADDFSFCVEIDPSYSEDDYHTSANSNQLTIKSPELTADMNYYEDVKKYVRTKFSLLYSTLGSRSATEESMSEILDIDSFTKVYLINELGKNWDAGVSSYYMVYKKDTDGKWKFFASPVWDYDNSLGNANGVAYELSDMGVSNYTSYEGWWCKYKGLSSRARTSTNIVNRCANNTVIMSRAAEIWFEDFVPAINIFKSSYSDTGELYSSSYYYELCRGTADMNYTRGWLLDTGDWIADHSKLKKASYSYSTKTYKVSTVTVKYPATFKGEFDYAADWFTSRAAWLSKEFAGSYKDRLTYKKGDVNGNGSVDITDATMIQLIAAGCNFTNPQKSAADVNGDGKIDVSDATHLQKYLAKMVEL